MKITNLVYTIPLIHAAANVTTNYFDAGTLNTGFLRTVYLFVVILLYLIRYKTPKIENLLFLISFFLLYNFILTLNNNELIYPLINFTKVFIPFTLIFVGYSVINTTDKLNKLNLSVVYAAGFYTTNVVISNIFNIGSSTYLDDTFFLGGSGVGVVNEVSIFTIVTLSYLFAINTKNKFDKLLSFLVIVCSIAIVFITMRRGAILTFAVSVITFLYISGYKIRNLRILILVLAILLALFPIYGDVLLERYNYRVDSREGSFANIEIEGRFMEFERIPNDLSDGGLVKWLFGTHNFNSFNYFGGREIHVGYLAILHGSGIIGFTLFSIIMLYLVRKGLKGFRNSHEFENKRILKALYFSLFIGLVIYLTTSRLHGYLVTTPVLLYLGSILGVLNSHSAK